MTQPNWTDVIAALGGILTPVVVLVIGIVITRRQSRSQHLQETRLEYYKALAPDLNRLMCYLTFIGTWRDESPQEIIELKRRLDSTFHVAAPLFSPAVSSAYRRVLNLSFTTFGNWGQDALIKSGPYRRRESWRRDDVPWSSEWSALFSKSAEEQISGESLMEYRHAYDLLLATLVKDLSITRARDRYTTTNVSRNADAPAHDIAGAPDSPATPD